MSGSDRRPYLTAVTLDQALLDDCHDNLETRLETVVEIELPGGGTIYASDRNKYVGSTFYEALLVFPVISRTVGEWLSPELQFSTLTLELSNVDGRFNPYLPGGASYGGWDGKEVLVKLGIAENASTYTTIFKGKITDIGGFRQTVKSIIIIARDDYDNINKNFPNTTLNETAYPKLEPKNVGKILPIIYGDFTTTTEPAPASVPAFVVNGNDPYVTFKEKSITAVTAPTAVAVFTVADHDFDEGDGIQLTTSGTLPAPFALLTTYYIKNKTQDTFQLSIPAFGSPIVTTGAGTGEHKVIAVGTRRKPRLRIAENTLLSFDVASVYLKRGDTYYRAPSADITLIGIENNEFELAQDTLGTWVESGPYTFETSDTFFVKVKGEDLGVYSDNIVWQARHILITFGLVSPSDFDATWTTYRDKASPAQSNIAGIKSRIWVGEQQGALNYALSLLEQVRLEAFIDRNLKIKINSLHFEDWNAAPTYTVKNWDIVKDSLQMFTDDRNNFNAARPVYNFLPDVNENAYAVAIYQNAASIAQKGKRIVKQIEFPNLYVKQDVIYQAIEILKISSSGFRQISVNLTWRSMLLDISGFVSMSTDIGSTILNGVPAMIREIGYDPDGLKIVARLWLMDLLPFPGYTPGYTGTVGGYSATITEET